MEIKQLHENLNITSVYVTHDQVEAMTLGQRLLVMNAGNVEQIGKPLELYNTPQTVFVAGFIGSPSMNLFPGTIGEDGEGITLPGGDDITSRGYRGQPGRPLTLGIRPEHFHLVDPAEALTQLQIDLVEELGADTLVYGHLGSDRTTLTVRLPGVVKAKAGERLPLMVEPDYVHVFDPSTSQRLN